MSELNPIFVSVVNAVLLAALPVLAVAVIGAVWSWGRAQWAQFRAMQPDVAEVLARYARIAVEAAEQAGAAKLIKNKKNYAIEITAGWLAQNGWSGIQVDLIAAEIERQVREMKRSDLWLAPKV